MLLIAGLIQALLTQASSSDRHGQPHSSRQSNDCGEAPISAKPETAVSPPSVGHVYLLVCSVRSV